jgi:hypothetical protein
VSSFVSKITAPLGALAVLALASFGAHAQEPSPAALNYAGEIVTETGMSQSLDQIVATMAIQLEQNVAATRPDLREPLHATLKAIGPEFLKTEQSLLADEARFLALRMTEQELKETAAFFASPAGKKYLVAQPAAVADLADAARAWRQKLSTDILDRAREEMKKKGYDF